MWRCKCQCGNECDVYATQLKSGKKLSCGCIAVEDREKRTIAKSIIKNGLTRSDDEKTDIFVKKYLQIYHLEKRQSVH